jgi:DNA-binding SARP family transcriptional activator
VIWIGAPAGSGKTTLAASYLAARKIKPLWYQFDTRDTDPAAFFAYLRQAAGRLAPRKRETLPLLTPEYAQGLPVFTLNFFDQLFNRLRAPAVLVFDNFQDLPEASSLHGLIEPLLSALPDNVTLIFLSRTQAPPSFAGVAAAQRLARIDAEALLLNIEEALAISKRIAPKTAVREEIEALNERAGGWTAGLILLLEGAGTADSRPLDADLFNYFAAEIMQRADPQTRAFLTASALLPVMDGESTEKLTGNAGAKDLLRDLVRRNYFIIRLVGTPVRYEFHPLFRDFLLAMLERHSSVEELRVLRFQAGRILSDQGEYAAAVELLSSAEVVEELQVLVLTHAERLILEGQYATLLQWLQLIPESEYREEPWLHYWYGVSRMPFDLQQARNRFERAYTLFEDKDDAIGLYLSWAGIAEIYNMMWDDFSGMEPWLEKYESLRSRYPDLPSLQLEIKVLGALFSVLIYLRPYHVSCIETCATLEGLLNTVTDPDFKIKLLLNINTYYLWCGDFASANRASDLMQQIFETEDVTLFSKILSAAGRSNVAWILGDTESSKHRAISALRLSRTAGIYFVRPLILSQMVYAYGMDNELDKMDETLCEIEKSLSTERRLDNAHYHYLLSWHQALRGNYELAVHLARQALDLARDLSAYLPIVLGRIELATWLIYLGEYTEAHALLDKAQEYALQQNGTFMEFSLKLTRAYAWLQQGDETACSSVLDRAFQLGMDFGYITSHTLHRCLLIPLCEFSLAKNIRPEFARLLIRKWGLVPNGAMLTTDAWPWPVKIHVLGTFSIEVDNQPIVTSGKRQKRVFELLKVLISFGGRDVAEQRICDMLWPEAQGDISHQTLKVTLHRLRKQIGQRAVLMNEGKLTLDSSRVWVDLLAFERWVNVIESAPDGDLIQLLDEANEIYKGHLLPGESTTWVLFARERLRDSFLRVTDRAAERLFGLGQWKAAVDCYQKALEIDPLAERFYIGLMRCYYELGRRAEGLVAYRRCCEVLSKELQIQPSSRTEAWHDRLRNSTY